MKVSEYDKSLIVTVVGTATIPMVIVATLMTFYSYQRELRSADQRLDSISLQLSQRLSTVLQTVVAYSQFLSANGEVQRGVMSDLFAGRAAGSLHRLVSGHPIVLGAYVFDLQPRQRISYPVGLILDDPPLTGDDDRLAVRVRSDQGYLQRVWSIAGNEVARYKDHRLSDFRYLELVRPIFGFMQKKIGQIVLIIPIQNLRNEILPYVPPGVTVTLQGASAKEGSHTKTHPIVIEAMTSDLYIVAGLVKNPTISDIWSRIRTSVWVAVLAVFACCLFGFLLAKRLLAQHGSVVASHEREKAELEKSKILTELNTLRVQMNPHFLFNSLNSISVLSQVDPKKTALAIESLGAVYRGVLASSKYQTVPFEKELGLVKRYLDLECLRFGDRLQVDYQVESIDFRIPGLILQTLVENAVKHGIAPSRPGGVITISALREQGGNLVEVRNTGTEIATPKVGTGTGLENTRQRLSLLYGDNYRLTLDVDRQGVTVASLWFPSEHPNEL